jgi:hypothetical protein
MKAAVGKAFQHLLKHVCHKQSSNSDKGSGYFDNISYWISQPHRMHNVKFDSMSAMY